MKLPALLRAAAAQAQVLLWHFGWACPLGAAALAIATGLYLGALVPAHTALAQAGAELARASARGAVEPQAAAPTSQEQRLQDLQAALQSTAGPAELIRRLGELARAEQVVLAQGDYQQQLHAGTRLVQLQVSQPVKASYPQLKRYIESVLRAMPNASLDQIAARRDNVGQAQLEVRLRWSFWIHAPKLAPAKEART